MDELYPSKELFDLINFYGEKVVQMACQLLEVDLPKPHLYVEVSTVHGQNE